MDEMPKRDPRPKELSITYFYNEDGEELATILKRHVQALLLTQLQENDTNGYGSG